MHKCYAMQILETEKTKTKEQWSQRITMKHKDHESQNRSGTQNHTNYLMKCLKLTSIKRFGEDVGILSFSRDILKTHNLSFNKILNKVISNLYAMATPGIFFRVFLNKHKLHNLIKRKICFSLWSNHIFPLDPKYFVHEETNSTTSLLAVKFVIY